MFITLKHYIRLTFFSLIVVLSNFDARAGNSSSFAEPTVDCLGDQTRQVADGSCSYLLEDFSSFLTINPDGQVITVTSTPSIDTPLAAGMHTVDLLISGDGGFMETCSFTLTVEDIELPTIACPSTQTRLANGSCNYILEDFAAAASVNDNCAVQSVTQSILAGTALSTGTQSITLEVTDASGNTADCTFELNVNDTELPTIACPSTQTRLVNGSCNYILEDFAASASVNDNCAVQSVTQSIPSGTVLSTGTYSITLEVTDASGNTADCTFELNVNDTELPTIACPSTQTRLANGSCNYILEDFAASASVNDNCSVASVTQSIPAGTVLSTGTYSITLEVTDASGNTADCTFELNVNDTELPTIACPSTQTRLANGSCNYILEDFAASASVNDNCSVASVTQSIPAGTVLSTGTYSITLEVTDASGNTTDCIFELNVNDTELPTIACPSTQTRLVNGSCNYILEDFAASASVNDNCSVASVTQSIPAGTVLSTGTYSIILEVTDASGNTADCTFELNVNDTELPTIACPSTQTRLVNGSCNYILEDFAASASVNDNCSVASVTQSILAGTVLSTGSYSITLEVTDASGNTADCTFELNVNDTELPTIACPSTQTRLVNGSCNYILEDFAASASVNDNCSVASVTQSIPAGTVLSTGTYSITLEVTDASGNTADCTFELNVNDTELPTIACPSTQTRLVNGSCNYILEDFAASASVNDNCSVASVTQSIPAGTVLSTGTYSITLEVTDASGNTTDCIFELNVNDTELPTIACPSTQTRLVNGSCNYILEDFAASASVNDNCSVASVTQSIPAGTVLSTGSYSITLEVTDASGNTADCTFELNVNDTELPTIACPSTQTRLVNGSCNYILEDFAASASVNDNCSVASVTQSIPAGTVLSTGSYSITLEVTDASGNTADCTFELNVNDTELPTIACPSTQTRLVNGSCNYILEDFAASASVNDNCAVQSVTQSIPSGTVLSTGTYSITLEVTDASGNTADCTFELNVNDTELPTIACPSTQTRIVNGSCNYILEDFAASASVNDNCSVALVTQSIPAGTVLSTGTYSITLEVTDASGNTADCTFELNVNDTELPTIACPSTQTRLANGSCNYILEDFAASASVNDNCSVASVTQSIPAGTVLSTGTYSITLEVTDASGNTTDCIFELNVNDTELPTIACPSTQTRLVNGSCNYILEDFAASASVNDNCSVASVTQSIPAGTVLSTGTYSITLEVTDASGNTTDCIFELNVNDTELPTIACPSTQTRLVNGSCNYILEDFAAAASVNDNCAVQSVTQSIPSGTVLSTGTYSITLEVTDASGNTADCTFELNVNDTELPTIACPSTQTRLVNGSCNYILEDFAASASVNDNCSVASVTQSIPSGTILSTGTYSITLEVTDASGNTADCTFELNVNDTELPTIACPSTQTRLANGSCNYILEDFAASASVNDNCSVALVTQSIPAGTVLSTGTYSITLEVTDASGNTADCTFELNVNDTELPTIACPSTQTRLVNGSCNYILEDFAASASVNDNCAVQSVTQSIPAWTVLSTGTYSITLEVTDASGNTADCTFELNVNDTELPTIACPSTQTRLANGSCNYILEDFAAAASVNDNCAVQSVTQSIPSGTVLSTGTYSITLEVTDASGNTADCTFELNVNDTELPVATCLPDQVREVDNSCGYIIEDFTTLVSVSDNCGVASVTQSIAAGAELTTGSYIITIVVVDLSGNESSCDFELSIIDTILPSIVCGADQTREVDAGCIYTVEDFTGFGLFNDNCSISSITQSIPEGTELSTGVYTMELTAEDASGNTETCSFELTVIDTQFPEITCPEDQVREVDENCLYSLENMLGLASFSDNCGLASFTQTPAPGEFLMPGENTIDLEVQDLSGNVSTCSFDLQIVDVIFPTLACPNEQTRFVDESCSYFIEDFSALASFADNCGVFEVIQTPAIGTVVSTGTTVVELEAVDLSGNAVTCSFDLIVADNIAPSLVCPPVQTRSMDANCTYVLEDVSGLTLINDNCGIASVEQIPAIGTTFETGSHSVNLTVTDLNGNQSTCEIEFDIIDSSAPELDTSAIGEGTYLFECPYTVDDFISTVTAMDNCGIASFVQEPAIGTELQAGNYEVSFTATDIHGNVTVFSFDLEVFDVTSPLIGCLPDQVRNTNEDCVYLLEDFLPQIPAGDECSDVTLVMSPVAGTPLSMGEHTITITAFDYSGNASTCEFDITVVDMAAPVIDCVGDLPRWVNGECFYELESFIGNGVATDNCGDVILQQTPEPGTPLLFGDHEITLLAFDEFGNSSTCSFVLTVMDIEAPIIDCPSEIVVSTEDGCTAPMPDIDAFCTVSDNCTLMSVSQIPFAGTIMNVGQHSLQIQAIDNSGNINYEWVNVIVTDNSAPEITCPSLESVGIDDDCGFTLPDYSTELIVFDGCGEVLVEMNPAPGTILGPGIHDILFTASDLSGLTSECTVQLEVIDDELPFIICQPTLERFLGENCLYTVEDFATVVSFGDNCEVTTTLQIPAIGSQLEQGTHTVEFTVEDASGNAANCSFELVLTKEIPLEISCVSDTILYLSDVACSVEAEISLPELENFCGDEEIVQTDGPLTGEEIGVGEYLVSFDVSNSLGEAGTCSYTIEVLDTIAPSIQCVEDIISCENTVTFDLPEASDNCELSSLIQIDMTGLSSGMEFPMGDTELIFEATDIHGNSSQCSFTITIAPSSSMVFLEEEISLCANDEGFDLNSILLGVEGDLEWQDAVNGFIDPLELEDGTFEVVVDDVIGQCHHTDTVIVIINPLPELELGTDFEICGAFASVIASTDGSSLEWNSTDEGITLTELGSNEAEIFSENYTTSLIYAEAVSDQGCTTTDSVAITFVAPPLPIDLGDDLELVGTDAIDLEIDHDGISTITWEWLTPNGSNVSFTDGTLSVQDLTETENTLVIIAGNGICPIETDTLNIGVFIDFFPNAISPNGDGANDVLEVPNLNGYNNVYLSVFDRRGQLVYDQEEYDNQWAGYGNDGGKLPNGTYYIIVEMDDKIHKDFLLIQR